MQNAYVGLLSLGRSEQMLGRSVAYVSEKLGRFLKKGDRVLICFPAGETGGIGWVMTRGVERCGAVPVLWGPDYRWKGLLQQAFYSRAIAIIAPPRIILGLAKLKRHNGTPIYIRHAVTAGSVCPDWMIDGIAKGLDCQTWGSFGLEDSCVAAGFSCGKSQGVHIWEEEYGVEVLDPQGRVLPAGQTGEVVLYSKSDLRLRCALGLTGRLEMEPCPCGEKTPCLTDIHPGRTVDEELYRLENQLQQWTSVLDCRVQRSAYGLELELVVFAGEKLPVLPPAARLTIKPWDPKHHEPFSYEEKVKNTDFFPDSH